MWSAEPVTGAVRVQCSAHGAAVGADVHVDDQVVVVRWHTPQRRVATGQSVVLYRDEVTADGATTEVVVGGGLAR